MSIQKKEFCGYIARCYWDHDEMYGYARVISPICQSPADVVDAIIEYLKEYFREMDERELSKQEWKAAKKNILDRLS